MKAAFPALGVEIGDTPLNTGGTLGGSYPQVSNLVMVLVRNSIVIAGVILLALLIFGGVNYIMAAGSDDAKAMQKAQSILTDAVIGFVVIFAATFIIRIAEIVTGLTIL